MANPCHLENSITTYWAHGDGSGALEYLDSFHDSDATLYARWDLDSGQRLSRVSVGGGRVEVIRRARYSGEVYELHWDAAGSRMRRRAAKP